MSSFDMTDMKEGVDALRDLLRRVDGGEVQLSNVSIAVDNDMQDFRTIDGRIAQSVLRGQTITYSIVAMLMPALTPPEVYTAPRIRDFSQREIDANGNFDPLAYAQNEYQRPPRPRGGFVDGRATGEGVVLPRPKVPRKPKEPTLAPVLGVPVRKIDI